MPAEFHYFPFDDGPGEDSMEDRWEAMMQFMRTTGVVIDWDQATLDPSVDDLAVTANGGLSVQVAVGEAWIHGFMFQQTDDYYSVTISPNSSGDPRIDLLTARLDTDANTIVYHVEEGTPAMSPVAPTPVESDPIWDLSLAEIEVADGAVTILSGDITDTRVISMQGAGGSSAVTLASAGGTTLVSDGAGPDLEIKGLTAGTDITLTPSGTAITIASTAGAGVTLTNAGSGSTLVNDGTGPSLATKGIVAGKNTVISTSSTDITFNSVGAITSATINMNTSIDPNVYRLFNLTVEADLTVTITDFDSSTTTSKASVYLIQDGTGGHTITFAGNVEFPGGIQPPNTEDPSSRDLFEFEWNGTDWMLVNNTSDYS